MYHSGRLSYREIRHIIVYNSITEKSNTQNSFRFAQARITMKDKSLVPTPDKENPVSERSGWEESFRKKWEDREQDHEGSSDETSSQSSDSNQRDRDREWAHEFKNRWTQGQDDNTADNVSPQRRNAAKPTSDSNTSLILRFWNGDVPLWKSYWLVGSLASIPIWFLINLVYAFSLGLAFLTTVSFQIYLAVGIWRSSNKYEGSQVWSVLAKVGIIFGCTIGLLYVFAFASLTLFISR